MHKLAVELADSTKHSFVVSLFLATLYLFIMAAYNSADPMATIWPPDMSHSFLGWTTIELVRGTLHDIPSMASNFSSFSAFDLLLTSGAIIVGFIVAALWYVIAKTTLFSRDDKVEQPLDGPRGVLEAMRKDKARLDELEQLCQVQQSHICKVEPQLARWQNEVANQSTVITWHLKHIQGQKNHIKAVEHALVVERNRSQQVEARHLHTIQQQQLHLTNGNNELTKVRQARSDLEFEVQVLKSSLSGDVIARGPESLSMSSLAPPFVLVLVDGDAYHWSLDHFTQQACPPGAHAAQAIKNEVQQYLISNKNRLSLQSRVTTRVFYNVEGRGAQEGRIGHLATGKLSEFARNFTESMPLFDYMDCGRGKERADSKIQGTYAVCVRRIESLTLGSENVHLFVRNPQCQTIFLAAVTDNGFARLLEQYAGDEDTKKKIVLVHPGFVRREIVALKFTAIEWPRVFQRQRQEHAAVMKERHLASRYEAERKENKRAVTVAIFQNVFGLEMLQTPRSYLLSVRPRRDHVEYKAFRDELLVEELD